MKYLIIILFFFSCSQVERVGENKSTTDAPSSTQQPIKIVEKVRVDTVYVDKTSKTPSYMVTADGNVVPQEGIHYKVVKADDDDMETVVKLVHLVYPNKYDISKVWYTHNVFLNKGSLLGDDQHATVITTVQTVGNKGYGTFIRHYIKIVDAYGNDIHTVGDEVKEIGKQKFEELLTILINS